MEDIIKTILDVVRVQHSATEGTDEKPFDMDDVVDMAMNVVGRPEEAEDATAMADSIQQMVESLAPDLFPPKTFEQMDDDERTASITNMLENRLKNGFTNAASVINPTYPQSESLYAMNSPVSPPSSTQTAASEEPEEDSGQGETNEYESSPSYADPASYEWEQAIQNAVGDAANGMNPQEAADLNNLIYKNLMEVMGVQDPRVEFPFDRSQIRYGQEKTFTEQLKEEEENQKRADREEREKRVRVSAADLAQDLIAREEPSSQPSAFELAQSAVDRDEEAHRKEPYVPPQPVEEPVTKTASQLAAEAIARAQEEDKMKLEIEKQAEALMAEAARRGQDPMKFALHQQEILRYMEKNSDELVSFEDYEDLSPEEKLELERQIYIDKQIEEGVDPDKVDTEVPEEYVPSELKVQAGPAADGSAAGGQAPGQEAGLSSDQPAEPLKPAMSEEMLRMLSQEVVRENTDMILSENSDEDIESLQEAIFQNLKQMMSGTGEPVPQEDVGDLIEQVIASNRENQLGASAAAMEADTGPAAGGAAATIGAGGASAAETGGSTGTSISEKGADTNDSAETGRGAVSGMSAVELARAAQQAARPEPKVVRETRSAADIAREAQEKAKEAKKAEEAAEESQETKTDADLLKDLAASLERDFADDFDDIEAGDEDTNNVPENKPEEASADRDDIVDEDVVPDEDASADENAAVDGKTVTREETAKGKEEAGKAEGPEDKEADIDGNPAFDELAESGEDLAVSDEESDSPADTDSEEILSETQEEDTEPDEEYEYVDPDEIVLGDHTQAEIDEALENLETLGLEGEVYERAKRMLLLELAGSEAELDAWLKEQENSRKKKAASSSLNDEDKDDLADLDHEELEKELEQAIDEDFLDEFDEEFESEDWDEESGQDEEAADSDEPGRETEDGEEPEEGDAEAEPEPESEEEKEEAESELESEGEKEEAESELESEEEKEEEESEEVPVDDEGYEESEAELEENDSEETDDILEKEPEERGYQVSMRKPFILKNSASFMNQFEDYITDTQENRKLSTGFKKLDAMLRYGLHKGSYFIDAQPQYLKNGFMQQIADRAAESGIDVLYISTELSRYDLMVETISRLSYEIHHGDPEKAVSPMAIMTGEEGADLASLKDELNWYRGRISEHLFILDQEAVYEFADSMEDASAGTILTELISSIVREGAHKPVVFIDNIENILSTEDSDDMRPLVEGIRKLAGELGIPILMSYGYAQAESVEELYPEEKEYHESLGNMCDVYLELQYADMITEDSVPLTADDIREMVEDGDSLLIDVLIHKNRRPMRASMQIQGAPKYNFFEE